MHPHSTIPYGYCHCGCGNKTNLAKKTNTRYGHVKGDPCKYCKDHNANTSNTPTINGKYAIEDHGYATPCWIWQRSLLRGGYGRVGNGRINGRKKFIYAHVLSYESVNGPVPTGLEIDHLCKNPACVNPTHLEAVTHDVNMQRSKNTKLTKGIVIAIRDGSTGKTIEEWAAECGVHRATIVRVLNNKHWRIGDRNGASAVQSMS